MKLYQLPRQSRFRIVQEGATAIPMKLPGQRGCVLSDHIFILETIDGMYSRCFDAFGNLHHWSANLEVLPIESVEEV